MWLRYSVFFIFGFCAGFGTLLALFLVYGDYGNQPVASATTGAQAATTPMPTSIPATTGPSYEAVCKPDTSNMTDPQITAYAERWIGQRFSGWQGFVYDVVSRSDGTYNLEIAMQERGFLWTRDLVIENIPVDVATRLNVEQPVTLSGRIASVDTTFEVMCNPLIVTEYALQE